MNILYSANKGGTRQRQKEADFFRKRRKSMDIVYKKVNAQITPEALAKLKQKDHFESTNQQKLKGRYSIGVVFDHWQNYIR